MLACEVKNKRVEMATSAGTKKSNDRSTERPLVEDIRLLGRILGDVIREQEGVAAYELVEQIRKLSVAFRRDADTEADKALKRLLKGLSGDQTVSVIFSTDFPPLSHTAASVNRGLPKLQYSTTGSQKRGPHRSEQDRTH